MCRFQNYDQSSTMKRRIKQLQFIIAAQEQNCFYSSTFKIQNFIEQSAFHSMSIIPTFFNCSVVHGLIFHILQSKFHTITTQVYWFACTNRTAVADMCFTSSWQHWSQYILNFSLKIFGHHINICERNMNYHYKIVCGITPKMELLIKNIYHGGILTTWSCYWRQFKITCNYN